MKKLDVNRIVILGMVAAIYVAITVPLSQFAYMGVQFRVSEALVLLCFYRKEYCFSMVIGCAIANLFSPMWAVDIIFGTLATLLAVICVYLSKNLFIASIFPVVFNAVIIGFELYYMFELPLWLSMLQVGIGQFLCVCIIGIVLFKSLERNKRFMSLIHFGQAPTKRIAKMTA